MPQTPTTRSGGKTPRGGVRAGGLTNGLIQVLVVFLISALLFLRALIQYHTALGVEHESTNIGDFVSNIIKEDLKAIRSADIPGAVTRIEGELIHKITDVVGESDQSSKLGNYYLRRGPPLEERGVDSDFFGASQLCSSKKAGFDRNSYPK